MATLDPRPGEAAAAVPSRGPARTSRRLEHGSRSRRLVLAACLYVATTCVFAVFAGRERLTEHTRYNHYALLADAWLHGRQDLAHGPPSYAMNNDFAEFHGKTFISFPPFPALLMLPLVKLAGSPEEFRDGQFVIELAGIAPALLFLVLEKLRRTGRSPRTERENLILAALYAFGTVYFFTAVEGTVWFAAMVVGSALSAFYTLWALDAERPVFAGAMLACAYMTRPSVLFLAPLFAFEALRVCRNGAAPSAPVEEGAAPRWRTPLAGVAVPALAYKYALFSAPILVAFAIAAWMNGTRYGRPSPIWFDHEFLAVAWQSRMLKWGMFSYHYLAKNLGVALTSLPWLPPRGVPTPSTAPFAINEHGLALWFTTPLYLWILWPKNLDSKPASQWLYTVVALAVGLVAMVDLLYQNTGWRQFGYRFSSDYSVLLFVLLAIGGRPMRGLFAAAAVWSIAWNAFGAATFDKTGFDRFYFRDSSQTVLYQPD